MLEVLLYVAIVSKSQQADTGTKMVHLGKNTKSTIISKGISAMHGVNAYRGLVRVGKMLQMLEISLSVTHF